MNVSKRSSAARHRRLKDTSPSERRRQANEETSWLDALDRFQPAARKLHAKQVKHCRADLDIVHHNLARGLEAVLAHEDHVRKALPEIDLDELRDVLDLSLALRIAASAARERQRSRGALPKMLAEARRLRKVLLLSAETLALTGILDGYVISKIRGGNGPFDTAMDCIELGEIYFANAEKIRGKSPVTDDDVRAISAIGQELQTRLTPMKAERPPDPESLAAIELRDRLWTLLLQRHETLWKVGAYLFGFAVESRVPPLQTRKPGRNKRGA